MELLYLIQEDWSNNACLGYALKALKDLNYSEGEIERILTAIGSQFDLLSVEDASELYSKEWC